jgi:hypothetical protein
MKHVGNDARYIEHRVEYFLPIHRWNNTYIFMRSIMYADMNRHEYYIIGVYLHVR